MLILIVMLVLFLLVLAALITGWSTWIQGVLYTEPSTGLIWRGPAAAGAITAVFLLWVILDYRAPGRYRPIWEYSSTETAPHAAELRVPTGKDKEDVYKLHKGPPALYRSSDNRSLPSNLESVVIIEDGARVVFEAERDKEGKLLRRESRFGPKDPLAYKDAKGRVIYENQMGRVVTFRTGSLIGNVFINILFLAACFLSLWLLTRFHWPHALGHAIVLCAVLLLFVLPPILNYAESVSQDATAKKKV